MAQAQGQANLDAAKYNNRTNRVNQITPYGSQTWSSTPQFDQQGYDKAMADWNNAGGKKSDLAMPNREAFAWEDWTQNQTLAPAQQALLDSSNRIGQNLADTAESGLGRVSRAMGSQFDTSGLPQLSSLGQGMARAQAGVPMTQLNGGQGYEQSRQSIVDALMARNQPGLQQARQAKETQLLNSGIERGTDAWNREQDNLSRGENDARMAAVLAGGQEQSRLAGLDQNAAQFANQAQGQQFTQQMSLDNLVNALESQRAGFNNQSRQQGIQEQAYLRSLPLNELNALRSGAQVTSPQFGNYYTANTQAAPVMDAAIAQGNYNMQQAAQQQSGMNSLMGGLATLGSAAIISDRRRKTGITYLDQHPIGVLRATWTWEDGSPGFGVIAQDLPAAYTIQGSDGYLRVNYAALGGF